MSESGPTQPPIEGLLAAQKRELDRLKWLTVAAKADIAVLKRKIHDEKHGVRQEPSPG